MIIFLVILSVAVIVLIAVVVQNDPPNRTEDEHDDLPMPEGLAEWRRQIHS